MDTSQLFYLFVVLGLLLMGMEIFVPGGVLGVMGGIALLVAVGLGFAAFGPQKGLMAAVAIFIFLVITIVLWMTLLPKTRLGKTLTLSTDTGGFRSSNTSMASLMGNEGVALTPLGPSGIARIDGRRVDVVAEGKWIEAGATIRVVHVVGNHATVREIAPAPKESAV